MKLSDAGLRFIAKNEAAAGPKLQAYLDTGGVPTIGYGHTHNVRMGDACTPELALWWLRADAADAEAEVNRVVTVPVNQNQFDALVDFVFNIGKTGFEHSALFRYLNSGRPDKAALEFPNWKYDNHKVVEGLVNRRAREKALFETPA